MALPRLDSRSPDPAPPRQRRAAIKDTPRKPPLTPSQLRARLQGAWMHRGYHVFRRSEGWQATHKVWRLFPRQPVEFWWRDYDDIEGFKRYIDAWYRGDLAHTQFIEKQQTAFNVIFPDPHDVQQLVTQQVSCRRLFDCLRLTDRAELPLWGRVAFVTNGHYLVPAEYITLLAEIDPDGLGHLKDQPGPWRAAKENDLASLGLTPEQVTSGLYLRGRPGVEVRPSTSTTTPVHQSAVGLPEPARVEAEPPPAAPPRERTIWRREHPDYTDWLTHAVPPQGPAWYTRRLYRNDHVLYAATAWSSDGPWQVWERDSAALLALDLDL